MHLVVVASMQYSHCRGQNNIELTTEECWSGKYILTFILQSYSIPLLLNPLQSTFTNFLLISAWSNRTILLSLAFEFILTSYFHQLYIIGGELYSVLTDKTFILLQKPMKKIANTRDCFIMASHIISICKQMNPISFLMST